MRNENYTCDHCRKDLDGRPAMTITFFIPTKYQNRQAIERDLCSNCVVETLAWIDRGVA